MVERNIYDSMTLYNGENLTLVGRILVKRFRVSDRQWQREKFAFRRRQTMAKFNGL